MFAFHVGFAATHHPSPVPLFVQLGVAAAGGLAVLAAPRLTLLVRDLVTRFDTVPPHAPRATALRS